MRDEVSSLSFSVSEVTASCSEGWTFSGRMIGHFFSVGVATVASTRVRFALTGLNGFTIWAIGGLGSSLSRLITGLSGDVSF